MLSDSSQHRPPGAAGRRATALGPPRPAACPTGAVAWLFITPTIVLLLAINIFPLVWTIYLSFTNYRANRANAPVEMARAATGTSRILTDPDIWAAMQVTAHFVIWTVVMRPCSASGSPG